MTGFTIACGAVSGFHSLVSSGTSSKQIKNERSMLPVSFGAMLLECFLAIIALVAVGSFATGSAELGQTPPAIFSSAIAGFLTKIGIPHDISNTLLNLSVSAFALTSLDSVARVGRIALQELFTDDDIPKEERGPIRSAFMNKYVATGATLIVAYMLSQVGYKSIWPLFGSANQLLSALALIACAVFLKRTNRQGVMLWAPMFCMLAITFSALALTIKNLVVKMIDIGISFGPKKDYTGFIITQDGLQLLFAICLVILGFIVALKGIEKLFRGKTKEALQ